MTITPTLTQMALKEWAVAIAALTAGDTILLLRKGGIQEREFTIPQARFWLCPTFEHQKPQLLKPPYAAKVTRVESGWHPETIAISAWAEITNSFQVSQADTLAALMPFHIWSTDFITDRLKWKPQTPISVLLLRVHRLVEPQILEYRSTYGGCKSWIELESDLTDDATPVLGDQNYAHQVATIRQIIETAVPQPE